MRRLLVGRTFTGWRRAISILLVLVVLSQTVAPAAVALDNSGQAMARTDRTQLLTPEQLQTRPMPSPAAQLAAVPSATDVIVQELPIELSAGEAAVGASTVGRLSAKARPGELIVRYRQGSDAAPSGLTMQALQLVDSGERIGEDTSLILFDPAVSLEEKMAEVKLDPDVLYVEPNYELAALGIPNDPEYINQWGLPETEAPYAWTVAELNLAVAPAQASPVLLAVLDTGVDSDHQDLTGRVTVGYNALNGSTETEDDSANSHGTAVAGIAAASTNNNLGIAGAAGAYPVEILPVKVLDAAGIGSMLGVAQGIRWAVDNEAKVINLSLGARLPDYPQTLADAVKYAQDNGVLVVAAAGNDGGTVDGFYPACLPGVISVGASGTDHKPAAFSNSYPRLYAPGVNILSTLQDDQYGQISGTSMAAPFVSGTAALLWSVCPGKSLPELSTALQQGRKLYSTGLYTTSYVANTSVALSKLQTPGQVSPWVEILQPTADSHVGGQLDLLAAVYYAPKVSKVVFTLTADLQDALPLVLDTVTAADISDSGVVQRSYDLSQLPGGSYTLDATWYDAENYDYFGDQVTIIVSNGHTADLSLQVKKPDGNPAAGAKVTVFHVQLDSNTGHYQMQPANTDGPVFAGAADLQGRVLIPAIDAINGNDFLVIAQGTDPNFLYHQLVHSPGSYVLDQARQVRLTAGKVDGSPLPAALLLVDLLDVDLAQGYAEPGVLSQRLVAQFDALGTAEVWLSPGDHEFRVASSADGYYLHRTVAIAATVEPLDLSFVPLPNEVAEIRWLADGEMPESTVQLRDEQSGALAGFECVSASKLFIVSPGTYAPLITAAKADAETGVKWSLELVPPAFAVGAGTTKYLEFGGAIRPTLVNDTAYQGGWPTDGTAYFVASFSDSHGNSVAGVSCPNFSYSDLTPRVEIYNGPTLLETRMAWLPAGYTNWSTPSTPGAFQAIAKLRVGPFAVAADGWIVSDSLSFVVKQAEVVPPVQTDGMTVIVIDSAGQPVVGAMVYLMEKTSDGYRVADYCQTTDNAGKVTYSYFQPQPGKAYAVGVYGVGQVAAAPEAAGQPFFLLVSEISADAALAVTVDLRTETLHRLLLQPRDQNGAVFSDYGTDNAQELDFSLYGYDSSGVSGGITLTSAALAELAIWVPEGAYLVDVRTAWQSGQASSLSTTGLNEQMTYWGPPIYQMTRQLQVGPADATEISVPLGGVNLISLTAEIATTAGPLAEYAIGGVAVHAPGQAVTTPFAPQRTQPIYLEPGTYQVDAALVRRHYDQGSGEGNWCYWLGNELSLQSNKTWLIDDAFTGSVSVSASYQGGELLESVHRITDGQGNRLKNIMTGTGLSLGWNYYGYAASVPLEPQNHQEIAPFLVIKDSAGVELSRSKQADPNYFNILSSWEYGLPVIGFIPTTSYFQGSYQIPTDILGGEYTALLELGVGPQGMITAEQVFTINNDTAAPQLEALPELTNAAAVNISGLTTPQATVTISYCVGQGESAEAGTVTASSDGRFNLSFTFPAGQDGVYSFTARTNVGGVQSDPSLPVTILVDRTAPAAPHQLVGTVEDANHITLSWQHGTPAEVSYFRLSRDGVMLADIPANSAWVYADSGLTALTEYRYAILAVDRAGNSSLPTEIVLRTSQETDKVPPAAPAASPQVFYRPGGLADVYWQATTDNIAVAGYKLFRAVAGGAPEEIGVVTADQPALEFHDQGLLAETVYAYSVAAYDAAGNLSAPSPTFTLTTPAPTISLVTWRFPFNMGRTDLAMVNPGAVLTIKLTGERSRQAAAEVRYLSLADGNGGLLPEPAELISVAPLTELVASPGVYQGTFTVPAAATSVTAITGTLTDGAEHRALRPAGGLPLQVAGSLKVELDSEPSAELDGYQLVVYSPTAKQGSTQVVNLTTLTNDFAGLAPAGDYSIRLLNVANRQLLELTGVVISGGQQATVQLTPPRLATLSVQILIPGAEERPLGDALIGFENTTTGQCLIALTDANGLANSTGLDVRTGDTVFATVLLRAANATLPYFNEDRTLLTVVESGSTQVIRLRPLPMGLITGRTVLDVGGAGLPGIIVTATQWVDGRSVTVKTTSDANGDYRLEAPVGSVTLSAGDPTTRYLEITEQKVSLSADGLVQDLTLSTLGKATVDVTIESKYIDSDLVTITGMDWWTAAHFGLTAQDAAGRINGAYPLNLRGRPGDVIKLSISGQEAGLPRQEVLVVLNSARIGIGADGQPGAKFVLEEQGRLVGSVRDEQGNVINQDINPLAVFSATVYTDLADAPGKYVSSTSIKDGAFQISVPEPGKYWLKLLYDPYFYEYYN